MWNNKLEIKLVMAILMTVACFVQAKPQVKQQATPEVKQQVKSQVKQRARQKMSQKPLTSSQRQSPANVVTVPQTELTTNQNPLMTPAPQISTANVLEAKAFNPNITKPWNLMVSVEYAPENNQQTDSFANYFFAGGYGFGKHRLAFLQWVSQTIIPEPGQEPTFEWLDPRFDYFYSFTEPSDERFSLKLRFRSQPGWGKRSKEDGIVAINSLRLEFQKPIDKFSFGLRPYVAHYWTEYSVNAKNEPLPIMALGHNLVLGFKFTKNFSWNMEVDTGFRMLQPEEVKTVAAMSAQPSGAPTTLETVKTSFFAATELAYKVTSSFAARLGYMQKDSLIDDGLYSIAFLDPMTSRYYIGLDYSF